MNDNPSFSILLCTELKVFQNSVCLILRTLIHFPYSSGIWLQAHCTCNFVLQIFFLFLMVIVLLVTKGVEL
jgi:hypothetical protein